MHINHGECTSGSLTTISSGPQPANPDDMVVSDLDDKDDDEDGFGDDFQDVVAKYGYAEAAANPSSEPTPSIGNDQGVILLNPQRRWFSEVLCSLRRFANSLIVREKRFS